MQSRPALTLSPGATRITVLFGGPSPEYISSLQSALGILEHKKNLIEYFDLVPCFMTKKCHWLNEEDSSEVLSSYSAGASEEELNNIIDRGERNSADPRDIVNTSSAVFPAIHGALGEDGVILGFCGVLEVPCIGCNIHTSVVCLDKATCKAVLQQAQLPVVIHQLILPRDDDDEPPATTFAANLPLPWLVKPCDGGCSIGASYVDSVSDLPPALAKCRERYPESAILIEQYVDDKLELDVAVMLEKFGSNKLLVTPCGLRQDFDHTTNSSASVSSESTLPSRRSPPENQQQGNVPSWAVPAPGIPEDKVQEMQNMAKAAFRAVRATHFLRVDFFYRKSTGEIWINEINTMPSLTRGCMFFKLWEAAGISTPKLIKRWVGWALAQEVAGKGVTEAIQRVPAEQRGISVE